MIEVKAVGWLTAVLVAWLLFFVWYGRYKYGRLLATIEEVTIADVPSIHLSNQRPIYVYLPPAYHAQPERRYNVLYVNDGQDRIALNIRYTVARLCAAGRIDPPIIVAVPTNEERLLEYGTAVTVNAQGLGSKAHAFSRFMVEEVMPLINREYRTRTGAAHTAVLGASLGGLSAFDMAWNHPDLFGAVGVFSGSFWWRAGETDPHIPPHTLIMHEVVRHSQKRQGFRAWFQAGTLDETADRDNDGVIDAIQDTLELIAELERLGYEREREVVYVEVQGGRHNYDTWAAVLPDFLMWAFPIP